MEEYRRSSHCLFDLKVHVVWITKYRKPILIGQDALRVRDMVRKICADLEVDILAGNIRRDHIHLLLSYPPQLCISRLVQKMKGITSRKLLQESNKLRKELWGRHLWARGYFAVSTGHVTEEVIAEYIKNQDEFERRRATDNFSVGF
jgi:putative transposase